MGGNLAVVDASAIAAILFGEPQGEEVAEALGDRELIAPTLLRYELGSVCLKKRKLYLKDQISWLQSRLIPDLDA